MQFFKIRQWSVRCSQSRLPEIAKDYAKLSVSRVRCLEFNDQRPPGTAACSANILSIHASIYPLKFQDTRAEYDLFGGGKERGGGDIGATPFKIRALPMLNMG